MTQTQACWLQMPLPVRRARQPHLATWIVLGTSWWAQLEPWACPRVLQGAFPPGSELFMGLLRNLVRHDSGVGANCRHRHRPQGKGSQSVTGRLAARLPIWVHKSCGGGILAQQSVALRAAGIWDMRSQNQMGTGV